MYVLDKKIENNVSPLTTYSFTDFKKGRKVVYITRTCGTEHYMITFRLGHTHIKIADSISVPV